MNRWYVLLPALLASAALVWLDDSPAPHAEVVAPTPPRSKVEAAQPPTLRLPELLDRKKLYPTSTRLSDVRDLFAGHSWTDPEPQADSVGVPAVPDFPFVFIGKKLEGGVWEVFLSKGDTTMVLKEGDIAEQVYQVVRIAPPELTVAYLPMNHLHSLLIGDAE